LLTNSGLAGELSGAVALNVPGITLSGALTLQINETSSVINELIQVGDQQLLLSLPMGPFLRIAGEGVSLDVLGQTLSGDFALTKSTNVNLQIANGQLDFGGGLVQVNDLSADFTISDAGIAGSASAGVSINVPGVSFGSDLLTLEIDTTDPADRFVRITGTGVSLEVAGQSVGGDFSFEDAVSPSGDRIVKVAVDNVTLQLGDDDGTLVDITDGSGQLLITDQGIAANLLITGFTFNVPGIDTVGLQSGGSINVQINTIPTAIEETFEINSTMTTLKLPARTRSAVTSSSSSRRSTARPSRAWRPRT
ncbi:MAG: hypothetical protein ACYTGQ_20125, partial [Planctomycetota bacterium]